MSKPVAIITGGSSGIGLATARLLSHWGVRLYLVARDGERLDQASAEIGGARSLSGDLADMDGANAVFESFAQRESRLDILINCVGQLEVGPWQTLGTNVDERLSRVNYLGVTRATECALPFLQNGEHRSIINVSSIAGWLTPPYMGGYAATKAALNAHTRALRQELRPQGFQVALVSAGPVATPMIEGRIRTRYYPLPWGVPVIAPQRVARAIARCLRARRREVIVPWHLGPLARISAAFPGITDGIYRWIGGDTSHDPQLTAGRDDPDNES